MDSRSGRPFNLATYTNGALQGQTSFQHSTAYSPFSQFGDDANFAAALANFQPCHDCTPLTKTAIPHHHHPPTGRLSGASATLDGHYCCSWLIHEDQPCYLCFGSAETLDDHIKADHAGKDGTYRCHWQNCGKHDLSKVIPQQAAPLCFTNKPKLMRHVHSHTGYKPFPCPYPGCDKGFVTKEQLKNHETTHTKARRYKCDLCEKAFAVKSALTTHIQAVHKDEKTHICDICGKAFADSSNLSKHKQIHWKEKSSGAGIRKQRARRGTDTAISERTTPSISTPSLTPETPVASQRGNLSMVQNPIGLAAHGMLPPVGFRPMPQHDSCMTLPSCCMPALSAPCTTPTPTTFDPNCYCCDQACPPPAGPVTPCDSPGDCGLEGFCDIPECLGEETCEAGLSCPDAALAVYCCEDQDCESQANGWQWDDLLQQGGSKSWGEVDWAGHEQNEG